MHSNIHRYSDWYIVSRVYEMCFLLLLKLYILKLNACFKHNNMPDLQMHFIHYYQTIHNVVSLHSDICASCRMRKRGPNGMPIFCKRSSPKYGSSIIPTRSASNRFAYFWWWEKVTHEISKMIFAVNFEFKISNLTYFVSQWSQKKPH